jgi:hypothetical protein
MVAGLTLVSAAPAHADSNTAIQQAAATTLRPAGGNNTSNITQVGNNNYAETDQTGAFNYAGIGQFGDGNYAKIVQDAQGAVAIYNQYGSANQVTITQTGVNPPPVVVTQHR